MDTSLVVDCPVCRRTVWANSVCHHGEVVLRPVRVTADNTDDAELLEPQEPRPPKSIRRRDKGH